MDRFAATVRDDVRRLLRGKGDRWLGCIEWHVHASGRVSARTENRLDGRILNAALDEERNALDEDDDDDDVLAVLYVRLEPGVYVGGGDVEGSVVRRVFNINNVEFHESVRGRGEFTRLLDVLEAWMRGDDDDDGDGVNYRPRAIMVQNICNERFKKFLLEKRAGWSVVDTEFNTVMIIHRN